MDICPVCGQSVDRLEAYLAEFSGDVRFFCSRACLEAFERDPARYVAVPREAER
ncbi:MAG TPA: YHS domain-containing protein [Elusimicrobiota bacterium]|jgi:YHS domain-containing protein|nr:YHS domain-containing protein [Elusimicrobiota bacterium]HMX42917.1 YHS domain-containing protein [Elusimicrobiota bacterium]HMX93685.1 YHS domain-containing protein [Elusimicrobiota bacterium]HMZ26917.1 YHS domain-containing protein [Elusimicrobiota bacterium]HNA59919.1 YHS domain-containing protein [Elusimicrobiota bacterium]